MARAETTRINCGGGVAILACIMLIALSIVAPISRALLSRTPPHEYRNGSSVGGMEGGVKG